MRQGEADMIRKYWLAALAVIVLIAAAFLALFWEFGDSSVSELIARQTAQESGLTPETQTPVYVPPAETLDETEDADTDADASKTAILQPSKYQFQSAEDALNYYAKMVGDEAERLKNDPSFTPPEPTMMYSDEHVSWEDSWYGGIATSIVYSKVFENDEMPELEKALLQFVNEWEPKDWSPPHLMVRAGKWPSAVLRNDVKLPNGQIIDLNTMIGKKVVVKYRLRTGRSETERQQIIANLMRKDSELLSRFLSEASTETDLEPSQIDLARDLIILEIMEEPEYTDHERIYNSGDEEVIFDLGFIEEDLSNQ